jgi:heterodisulfide reductase subunit B
MTTGYYPGCSAHGSAPEYGESLHAIAPRLDLDLEVIEDWNCCGASSAHATNHDLGIALAARNLALAKEQGLNQLVAPCAACYSRLSFARRALENDAERERMDGIVGRTCSPDVDVLNVLEVLVERLPRIAEQATDALNGVRFACYYGCLLVKPNDVTGFDDPERPTAMERIVEAAGGAPVDWPMATECCGAGFSMARTDSVLRLGRGILNAAQKARAAAVVVACPMCHSNLDFRQEAMARRGAPPLPVLFITQLVGLALGVGDESLGLRRHFVDPRPFAEELRAAATGLPAAALAARSTRRSAPEAARDGDD